VEISIAHSPDLTNKHLETIMAIFEKNKSSRLGLVALMVMATVLSSCHANQDPVDRKSPYVLSTMLTYMVFLHYRTYLEKWFSCSDGGDRCVRTLLNCSLPRCSKLCNYVDGAHCTDISKCSCCPIAAAVAPHQTQAGEVMEWHLIRIGGSCSTSQFNKANCNRSTSQKLRSAMDQFL
jgi:hypothetical protein